MLKNRLLTAFILGPLILWGIYVLPEIYFAIFMTVVVSFGAWEWSNFAEIKEPAYRFAFLVINITLFISVIFLNNFNLNIAIIAASLVWWILSIPLLFTFPFASKHLLNYKPLKLILGVVLLLATLVSIVLIRNNPNYGAEFVLYLILMIWFADSAAYFSGRAFGKHKLMPNVSPGKTWEGVFGAMFITLILSLVAVNLFNIASSHSMIFIIVSMITVAYSIIGDLSESMFKRMINIKDSGTLLPGHGGMLDRIDSLLSALPVFIAGLWMMERFS